MDDTRYEYATTPASGLWRRRMAARILSSSWLSTIAATTARAAQKLRLHRVFSTKSWPGRMLAWLPVRHARKIPQFTQDDTNTALLFSGCVATRFESAAVAGALDVGRHLGLQLVIPDQHLCCGALYQHMGDKNRAQTLINKSVSVLEDKQDVPVAVLPSGCGKGLSENLAASDSAEARNLRKRLVDLCELFEDAASRNPAIGFRKSDTRVALYFPCSSTVSQRNALRTLLARVPGTEIIILQEGYGCCGASGDHMISDAEGADVFATPIIDEIVAQAPHTVLTVNPGCAWHLRANLRSIKAHIPVLHPVEWLASCL